MLNAYNDRKKPDAQRRGTVMASDNNTAEKHHGRQPVPLADRQQAEGHWHPACPRSRKIGDTNTLPDRPEIRGMIARVPHLID